MDIPNSQNKAMDSSAASNKEVQPTTIKAVSVLENEYFYPQSNGYQSISVRAATLSDAEAIYLAKRQPVIVNTPDPVTTESEEKVAETTNNE